MGATEGSRGDDPADLAWLYAEALETAVTIGRGDLIASLIESIASSIPSALADRRPPLFHDPPLRCAASG